MPELPKDHTNQFPLDAGHVPVATGVGLQVEARALTTSDISDMSNYATQEDLSNVLADANGQMGYGTTEELIQLMLLEI